MYLRHEISKYTRLNRLKWAGHVIKKEPIEIFKMIMAVEPEGRRKKVRPRIR